MNAVKWDDPSLQNAPGQWKPTQEPFRVVVHIRFGPRYDQYRSIVRTFATEPEARDYAATVPRRNNIDTSLYVAINPETWRENGRWASLRSPKTYSSRAIRAEVRS